MVFGIGNPLIDVVIQAEDADLLALGLEKGIMHLVTEAEQAQILEHFADRPRTYLPGGSAPNTLLALAGLGIPGKIGNDDFGRTYADQVSSYGITFRSMVPGWMPRMAAWSRTALSRRYSANHHRHMAMALRPDACALSMT
jgi:sugar/nucleoside kinase (ribokinase family)